MSLYLANPTKQHIEFNFRDPKSGLLAKVDIPTGGQVEIGHAWSREEKEKVIAFLHKSWEARDAAEAHGKMGGRFLGLLYRDTGVIDTDEIESGHAAVVDTQERRSASEATRAALGFDRAANQKLRGRRAAKMTEVVVEQELGPHARATGNEVAFSLAVDPEGRADAKLPT